MPTSAMPTYNFSQQRFFFEPEESFKYFHLIKTLATIQFFTEICTMFHVFYVLSIFVPAKVCHSHFKSVSCGFLVILILKAFTNLIVLSKFITGSTFIKSPTDYLILNLIQTSSNYAYYYYPLAVVLERTISLLWVKKYENYFSFIFMFFFTVIPPLCGVWLAVHLLFFQKHLHIFFSYFASNIFGTTYWTAYFIIYFCTKDRFKQKENQSLSERYQRFENRKTSRTMFWFAGASLLSIGFAGIYIQTQAHYDVLLPNLTAEIGDININALLRLMLDTAQGFIYFVMPAAFTLAHVKLKTQYMQIFICLRKRNQINMVTSEEEAGIIKSITGENLVRQNEQEYYFTTLVSEWENKYTVTEIKNPSKYAVEISHR